MEEAKHNTHGEDTRTAESKERERAGRSGCQRARGQNFKNPKRDREST